MTDNNFKKQSKAQNTRRKSGPPPKRHDRPAKPAKNVATLAADNKAERIAKVLARAGLCSRRDAEKWIEDGRVEVNGKVLNSPALNVTPNDRIVVDGAPLPTKDATRLWLYHKPKGLVTTNRDPEGRPTIFEKLPSDVPRVMTVGRLDINTEGLLLLTNDGGLARVLELPETGWLRRYRVRAHGRITQAELDKLKDGIVVEGVIYGSVEAEIDREQGANVWLNIGLREGKNREVKKILGHLGLVVNRLIRVSYGPFQLYQLGEGEVREVRGRVLRDQLGAKLIEKSGADFSARLEPDAEASPKKTAPAKTNGPRRAKKAHWSEDGGLNKKDVREVRKSRNNAKTGSGRPPIKSADKDARGRRQPGGNKAPRR